MSHGNSAQDYDSNITRFVAKYDYILDWISDTDSECDTFWIDCSDDSEGLGSICNTLAQSDSGIDIIPDRKRTSWGKFKM